MIKIRVFAIVATIFLAMFVIISTCEKKPTAPERDNPLDAHGVNYQGRPPVASFTVFPTSGYKTTVFNFNASACSDYDEPTSSLQVRWDWDGDGSYDTNYSTAKTTSHQYSNYGIKNVILQVKDSAELTDTTKQQIQIIDIPADMVYVAAGTFQMGSTSGYSNEQPVHPVTLDAFCIDKYEVTNAKYVAYLKAALAAGQIQASSSTVTKGGDELIDLDASYCQISYSSGTFVVDSGKDNYPVIEVTWYGADAYAKYYGKRLPTEAEWEYAARGGNLSQGYTYSGSNNLDAVGWYWDNSTNPSNPMYEGKGTHTVGTKQANELGIYDLSGNVWEWCNDWYGAYSSGSATNPQGPATGSYRVLRGGSWSVYASGSRVASRGVYNPGYSYYYVGFRCVR